MPPVCSNCGASDFVWANELKTGSIGGGTLSLRSRGELSMGTRICKACGHADLFLKDPSILRMPHTWKPGEFVPIPSGPTPPAHHPSHPGPGSASPPPPSAPNAPAEVAPSMMPAAPPPPAPPEASEPPSAVSPDARPASGDDASPSSGAGTRRGGRRRSKAGTGASSKTPPT